MTLPEDFDWVAARAAHSTALVFQKLRLQVEADVNKRNEIRTTNEREKYQFRFVSENGTFSVFAEGQLEDHEIGVSFRRTQTGIDVCALSGKVLLSGAVTLSNEGECRIKVEQTEYAFWQFRKLALEDVFFTQVARWRPV